MLTYVVISPTDTHTEIVESSDEFLTVAAGAYIAQTNTFPAVFSGNTVANETVNVEGSLAGFDGIELIYNTGNATATIGTTGTVTGAAMGIYFEAIFLDGGTGTQFVQNAGYIQGGTEGVDLDANNAEVENSGTIAGATAVNMQQATGGIVENDVGGLITGQVGVELAGTGARVLNAGTISATSSSGAAILASAAGDTLENSGDIEGGGAGPVVYFAAGADFVRNSGTINSAFGLDIEAKGINVDIENSGRISSQYSTILLDGNGGGTDWVVNDSGGVIVAQDNNYVIYVSHDAAHIVNHGDLLGDIQANAFDDVFTNTGEYDGEAAFGGGVVIRNGGKMSYESFPITAPTGANTPLMGQDDLVITGAAGHDDRLVNTVNGVIDAAGGVAIYHSAAGTFRIVNHGDIYGNINLLGAASVANVGLMAGDVTFGLGGSVLVNRVEIDGDVTFAGTGNIYRGLTGEVTGTIFGAGADGRYLGGAADDTFDMTASGAKYVSGGAGDDTFIFTAAGLTAPTRVLGGAGDDALTFTTVGTFSPSVFAHVSGIETINLAAGNNNLALTNALVGSADGDALTINGNNFVDTINASAVTTATDTVTMYGGHGADVMTAGGAKDVFLYQSVNESSGTVYDTIAGANFGVDRFDVSAAAKTVLAVNTAVTVGSLSTATFNADLATDLPAAKLGAHDAVLFTASAGTLSGQTFLVIDANGTAGYQANADLVVHLTGQTGTLTAASFI